MRFIVLADDNFYPVTLTDLAQAARRADKSRLHELEAIRQERFELMARFAKLPPDTVFFTQITMEAAEDPAFLDAMCEARIKGALVGVESVTPEGLKTVYKGFNLAGGGGVDGAIHRGGGPSIMAETRQKYPQGCSTGEAIPWWSTASSMR